MAEARPISPVQRPRSSIHPHLINPTLTGHWYEPPPPIEYVHVWDDWVGGGGPVGVPAGVGVVGGPAHPAAGDTEPYQGSARTRVVRTNGPPSYEETIARWIFFCA